MKSIHTATLLAAALVLSSVLPAVGQIDVSDGVTLPPGFTNPPPGLPIAPSPGGSGSSNVTYPGAGGSPITGPLSEIQGAVVRVLQTSGASVEFLDPFVSIQTGHEYLDFLGDISGATHANSLQATIYSSQVVNRLVQQRLNGARRATPGVLAVVESPAGGKAPVIDDKAPVVVPEESSVSMWVQGVGVWGEGDSDENAAGFDQSTGGVGIGIDFRIDDKNLFGIFGSYLNDDLDFAKSRGSTEIDTYQVGVYAQHDTETWYGNALVTYGWNDFDSNRRIRYLGQVDNAIGSYDGNVFTAYGEAGLKLQPGGGIRIEPFVGLGYVGADTDGFKESSDGPYALRVNDNSGTSFAGYLGIRGALEGDLGGVPVAINGHVAWQHEFEDTHQTVNAAFVNLPDARFAIDGTHFDRDSVIAGVDVSTELGRDVEAFIGYFGQFNSDYTANSVYGGVGISW